MASRILTFKVEVDLDRTVSAKEMAEYIESAVVWWAKGGNPEHPLFDLTDDDVRVVLWRNAQVKETV